VKYFIFFYGKKTIRIALTSVMIYLISSKLYYILSQILFWLVIDLKISNYFVQIILYVVISAVVLLCLFSLYYKLLKNHIPSITTIFILLSVTILLFLFVVLTNHLMGRYGSRITLNYSEYLSIYGNLHSLRGMFSGIYPLFALAFFLWKLNSRKTKNK